MNDQEINIAIAKACGWSVSEYGWWSHPALPDNGGAMPEPPNYCGNLNAMHEAEKIGQSLQAGFWTAYNAALKLAGAVYISHATARQRAEAFLRTIGKWEEAQ